MKAGIALSALAATTHEVRMESAAAATSAPAAIRDATRKSPSCSDRKPASVGPTI
jgi:hypothetical protein